MPLIKFQIQIKAVAHREVAFNMATLSTMLAWIARESHAAPKVP